VRARTDRHTADRPQDAGRGRSVQHRQQQELLTAAQRLAAYLADEKPKNVRGAA